MNVMIAFSLNSSAGRKIGLAEKTIEQTTEKMNLALKTIEVRDNENKRK